MPFQIVLLIQRMSTKLEMCNLEEDYVSRVMTTAQQLQENQFDISDQLLGAILLAGLPEKFKSMMLAIGSSDVPVTSDFIKAQILQDVKYHRQRSSPLPPLQIFLSGHRAESVSEAENHREQIIIMVRELIYHPRIYIITITILIRETIFRRCMLWL